jgi:hypothetical protein
VPGVWLAAFVPVVVIAVAVGLERLERHLSGPPHLDPKHATDHGSAEVPRPASGRQLRTVRMPSRLALVMASCVVLVVAGVTALVVGRSAPAPVPIPLFTEAPPAAVVSPPRLPLIFLKRSRRSARVLNADPRGGPELGRRGRRRRRESFRVWESSGRC